MTSPVSHGYPDWGRQVAAADVLVLSFVDIINATKTHGPFFVGNTPYVHVVGVGHTLPLRLTVRWFIDETLGQALGVDTLDSAQNGSIRQTIPIRGPWVTVQQEFSIYPSATTLRLFQVATLSADARGSALYNIILSVDGTAIGAGVTRTDSALKSRGGWIYWHAVFDGGVVTLHRLRAVDPFTGATLLLDTMGAALSSQGRMVFAPVQPLEVVSLNGDAVARNLYLSVIHHPFDS